MAKGKKLTSLERRALLDSSPSERRACFKRLLNHVRQGYSLDCFSDLSLNSILEFLKSYPLEFPAGELEDAKRDGKQGWEAIGRRQSDGTCLGNSRSWYYNMSNRFGWRDKIDVEAEHKGSVNVNVVNYASKKSSPDESRAS